MAPRDDKDWTAAWSTAPALALSTWTRQERRLEDPASARLLALILELSVLENRLALRGWVILPGALHLVAERPRPGRPRASGSWPGVLGRIKGLHARCDNRRLGLTGRVWRPGARIRPLRAGEVEAAALRCERAPVAAGLCSRPGDWPHSSAPAPP
jgi:hypothetical protein